MNINQFLFGNPVYRTLERNLDIQSARLEAASSNLANMDTPDYKAIEVDFEAALNTESTRINPEVPLATNPRHFGVSASSEPAIMTRVSDKPAFRVDGNTVNLDNELMTISQASGSYSASVVGLQRKYAMLATALQGEV